MEPTIDPKKVEEIFFDCLFKDREDTSKHVPVEGIVSNFGFHPERLKSHIEEIVALLNELPDAFKESSGGGWSFLKACNDRHGNQWTGFHQRMEQLFSLGLGIGKVVCLLPRDLWSALPGGMPYYMIRDKTPE